MSANKVGVSPFLKQVRNNKLSNIFVLIIPSWLFENFRRHVCVCVIAYNSIRLNPKGDTKTYHKKLFMEVFVVSILI